VKRHPVFRGVWLVANLVLFSSVLLLITGLIWEYSTRRYLEGFAEAVVPVEGTPEEKVEAILAWMRHGPARRAPDSDGSADTRDPVDTLNHQQLLAECGTATNAFVNLVDTSGLQARRLLLLDEKRVTKHVVAEVWIKDRWAVVDPLFRTFLRSPEGRLLTKDELKSPDVLRAAAQRIPKYDPSFTYESTAYIRLARIPLIGGFLRRPLNAFLPGWEEAVNWTLVTERRSMAVTLAGASLLFASIILRLGLGWYGERKLRVTRVRMRDQVMQLFQSFLRHPG
jgi:hypothetical protein